MGGNLPRTPMHVPSHSQGSRAENGNPEGATQAAPHIWLQGVDKDLANKKSMGNIGVNHVMKYGIIISHNRKNRANIASINLRFYNKINVNTEAL